MVDSSGGVVDCVVCVVMLGRFVGTVIMGVEGGDTTRLVTVGVVTGAELVAALVVVLIASVVVCLAADVVSCVTASDVVSCSEAAGVNSSVEIPDVD